MKTSRILTYSAALVALALLLAAPATAAPHRLAHPRAAARPASSLHEVHDLRRGIAWHRSRTWHFQDVAGVGRTPTSYAERKTRSVPYLRWIDRLWVHRQHVAHHLALVHPAIAHRKLWLCIHGTLNPYGHWEARTWDNEDTGGNGHYGGLQMSWSWGYNAYVRWGLQGDPASYSAYEQMAAAERGYRAEGYSHAWLLGQWYHPECLGYA